jgi:hypothetical protein
MGDRANASRPTARRFHAALLAILIGAGGCSLMLTEGPPVGHQAMHGFDCSTNYVPPVIDTALSGLAVANIAVAATRSSSEMQSANAPSAGAVVAVNIVMLALAAPSAVYGYSRVGSCREAKQALAERAAAPRDWPTLTAAPPALPPAPPAPVRPPPSAPVLAPASAPPLAGTPPPNSP